MRPMPVYASIRFETLALPQTLHFLPAFEKNHQNQSYILLMFVNTSQIANNSAMDCFNIVGEDAISNFQFRQVTDNLDRFHRNTDHP